MTDPSGPVPLTEHILGLVAEHYGDVTGPFEAALRETIAAADGPTRYAHEVTVLLSDIRGFTAISERYPAGDILQMLNQYFGRMNRIIQGYNGVIDKYMGDAVMVVFDFGPDGTRAAKAAVACAIEMQAAMDEVNTSNEKMGFPRLFAGIGINSGIVSSGPLGSDIHREFTVIGDAVNLAARIEPHSLRGQVLISGQTYDRVRDVVHTSATNEVRVKGKSEPVELHTVIGLDWEGRVLQVPQRETRTSIRVRLDAPFSFHRLHGKAVADDAIAGTIRDIGYTGLFAETQAPVEAMEDVRFELALSLFGGETREMYAKIVSVRPLADGYGCAMEFTSIDDRSQAAIKAYVDSMVQRR
jgi:adenylate cyclase